MAVLGEAGVQTRVIATYAPDAIKQRILPKVCTGECILAICMTEPHAGTDVANYRTNAVIKADRVNLNGTKTLISRAAEAGMFVVFTRIDGKPGREGIGCILVEPDTKGFAVTGTYHTMGGENLHEVQFNDCELPLENLVIREDGFRKLLTAFNTQRCLNPSISLGLAEGALNETVSYVREREIFGEIAGPPPRACGGNSPTCSRISKPAVACCIEHVPRLFSRSISLTPQRCSATRCPSG